MAESLVGYEHCYCLFLDILGFKSKVDETLGQVSQVTRNPISFPRLLAALNEIRHFTAYQQVTTIAGNEVDGELTRPTQRRVNQFSDSVVISYPCDDLGVGGLLSVVLDVQRLHLRMADYGLLLRGGITSGLLCHGADYVFGPAMNEAVSLEKEAKYPRVVIDPKAMKVFEKLTDFRRFGDSFPDGSTKSMIALDDDDQYFVDYFHLHPEHLFMDCEVEERWPDIAKLYLGLRNVVSDFLSIDDDLLLPKQKWLVSRYSQMAHDFNEGGRKVLGDIDIPSEYLSLFEKLTPIDCHERFFDFPLKERD
ncbi:MAG: hypothetical protein ABIK82_12380 [Pseudomonadota bacterium]